MKKTIQRLWKKQESRELIDPVYHEHYLIDFDLENIFLVSSKNEVKRKEAFQDSELIVKRLQPVYQRFEVKIDDYLENVYQTKKLWRFFDVDYGLDIRVNRHEKETGWEVWMGEDLSFFTMQQWEVREYVKGLITKGECWFGKEAKRELDFAL